METGDLISINEAAKLKGVSRQAVHAAIAAGKISVVKHRVTVTRSLITPAALDAWNPNPNMKRPGPKPDLT